MMDRKTLYSNKFVKIKCNNLQIIIYIYSSKTVKNGSKIKYFDEKAIGMHVRLGLY